MSIAARGRLFFIHVPKTAGMSMRAYLRNQYPPAAVYPAMDWREAVRSDQPLTNFSLYSGHFRANFAPKTPSGTSRLVVLRNPVARLLSALRHLRRDPSFHVDHALARGKTLSEILHTPEIMAQQYNVQVHWLAAAAGWTEVDDYLRQNPKGESSDIEAEVDDDTLLQRAQNALTEIDFIGFTEDLRPVLFHLSEAMNFHPVISFPRLNETREQDDPADHLDEAEKALIRHATSLDQKLYAFAQDLVEQRRVHATIRRLRTTQHYRIPDGAFEVSLQEPIPGSGWYVTETDAGRYFRWTGPDQRITLDLPLHDHDYTVTIMFNRRADDLAKNFAVTANMTPLAVDQISTGDRSFRASFIIPVGAIIAGQGAVRLVVDTGPTARPADAGEADDRLLGIVVFRIMVSPLSQITIGPDIVIPASANTPVRLPETAVEDDEIRQPPSVSDEPVQRDAPGDVPIIGDAALLIASEDLYPDLWAGRHLRLSLQPLQPIRTVRVHGWFHRDVPPHGTLAMQIGDQRVERPAEHGLFEITINLPQATLHPLHIALDTTDAMPVDGPDGRELAFVLRAVEISNVCDL